MHKQLLIVGAGIGGLAAALAARRRGWQPLVFEQSPGFGEVGAGVQLGPNATRVLQAWGLGDDLRAVMAAPAALRVHSAQGGRPIAALTLGSAAERRWGAPYATVHRADLHALLLAAARQAGIEPRSASRVIDVEGASAARADAATESAVALTTDTGRVQGDALVGADGLWSTVRQRVWQDGAARATGHLAYRALVPQSALPAAARGMDIRVWLGARLHVVAYPVRRGDFLNVVVLVEGRGEGDLADWDHAATSAELSASLARTGRELRAFVDAVSAAGAAWRRWVLCDRDPVAGPQALARGAVALVGDAAHPMLPYLAQGAAMAIEDAEVLAAALTSRPEHGVQAALAHYAQARWRRVARVQARSRRNGEIFHLQGPMRLARDAALGLVGERLMAMDWLYGARV